MHSFRWYLSRHDVNRAIELVLNHHFQKIVFLHIIGKRQIPQIVPLMVRAKLVNDKNIPNLSSV